MATEQQDATPKGIELSEMPMACSPLSPVPDHEDSLLPTGRTFHLVWHDEFDGDCLDRSKWGFRTHFWGNRFPAFADENDTDALEIKDSCAYLYLREKDGRFYSPHLQTGSLLYDGPLKEPSQRGFWPYGRRPEPSFMHKFGYYECRCKTQQKGGWWSAFWLQSPDIGSTLDPHRSGVECDIMESFEPGVVIPSCMHYNGYGPEYKHYSTAREKKNQNVLLEQAGFHRFGCLWEPDGYTFYIDGRQKGPKIGGVPEEPVSWAEQFVLISTESHNYRINGQPIEGLDKSVGDAFIVDYVRVFDFD